MDFSAHIPPEGDNRPDQTCQEHCRNVAYYTKNTMEAVSCPNLGYMAGLTHDMGKFKQEFRQYLEDIKAGKNPRRGSVNHTFCAPRFILENYHRPPTNNEAYYAALTSELLAFATGSHHGQFDCVDPNNKFGFDYRQSKEGIHYEESRDNFLNSCAGQTELDKLYKGAVVEVNQVITSIKGIMNDFSSLGKNEKMRAINNESCFYISLFARLILSALIDADRRDAWEYMSNERLILLSDDSERLQDVWNECATYAQDQHNQLHANALNTPLNDVRENIYAQCIDAARKPSGVYRLNVPTGGGKTLSVLNYALEHAKRFNKKRIIFTFPLLSILGQNVSVIRDNVPQDTEYILEHHSNVVQPDEAMESDEAAAISKDSVPEELNNYELLVETWDAPIIVTTLVQLLNTLFSGKSDCIRRFQALCNSVIVIDEVQTVPPKMVSMFNLAINFLSQICGATVVLCSATQPCLEQTIHSLAKTPEDLVKISPNQKKVFKRTELTYIHEKSLDQIAEYVAELMTDTKSLLIICNMKKQACELYNCLKNSADHTFHLSAGMCQVHREAVSGELKSALKSSQSGGSTVLCVATQVMEAGVDLSFERVIRFTAGLDNIIQSAGRQNREGESAVPTEMDIVTCNDEKLSHLTEIKDAKDATAVVLAEFEHDPLRFDEDLASDAAIALFYKELFRPKNFNDLGDTSLDYLLSEFSDKTSIVSLLGWNESFTDHNLTKYVMNQAFKTAGAYFKVFDDDSIQVVVPYGKGGELIERLNSSSSQFDLSYQKKLLEQAKGYIISLPLYQVKNLGRRGAVASICDGTVLVLQPSNYDEDCGVVEEPTESDFLGV